MDQVTALSLGRIAVGVAGLAASEPAAATLGAPVAANPQAPYVVRLFAVREVALGALTLVSRGPARRALVTAGVAVDAADAAVCVAAVRSGSVPVRSAAATGGVAVGAVVVGVLALARGRLSR
jgi:hypothetical protein